MASIPQPPPYSTPYLPYMEALNLIYLRKLINDQVSHDSNWPSMLTKLLLDIPKFKGKVVEDPIYHVMSFHLWCSLNRIIEYFVHLQLFQWTLMGPNTKWYVFEPIRTYKTFEGLAKTFLSFFHLFVRHNIGLELLTELHQTIASHIVDHIQKW